MTFEQIDYFIAVVKSDTFFDAAETLHITQSTLSKQIMKLEKELDIQLLDRTKRSASLTEAGKVFYEEALRLSREYHQTLLHMRNFRMQSPQKLCIGTLPILTQYHLTPLFKEFEEQYPQIHLTLDEVEETELMEGLSQGKYDLVIARKHMADSQKHSFHLLAEDRLVAVLPDTYPLTEKNSVSPADIAKERFVLMKPYTSIYQLCMELFQKYGIHPDIVRTARIESIISAVSIHEGISLLPEGNFNLFRHEGLTAIPLEPSPRLSVGIIRRKSRKPSPAVLHFIQAIRI